MMDFLGTDLEKIKEAIAKGTIFHSLVTKLGTEGEDEENAYMNVQLVDPRTFSGTYVGRIYKNESDSEMNRRSLMPLLGQEIPFVITDIDEEHGQLLCSRKKAQEAIKASMASDLASGKTMRAKIVKFMPFGAFVEINGISGMLRTTDFSTDHSEIAEYYKLGDHLNVVCREISEKGRISFKAAKMHTRKEPLKYDLEVNQVVIGEVTSLRTFARGSVAYVHIGLGLDCMCPMPDSFEIEHGCNVAVTITSIKPNENPTGSPHVRGRILRVY